MLNDEPPVGDWESWQTPYRYGALALWPPESVREPVNRWRERLDPKSHSYCEAHVTLTQPFKARVTDETLERLASLLADETPFEVTWGPLRSFLPSPVLWLEVQPRRHILALRRALHQTGLFDLSLPHTDGFVPHMTVTEGLSGAPVDEALHRALGPEFAGGTFVCDRIVLLRPDASFRFRVAEEIALRAR